MIHKWITEDISKAFENRSNRFVISDPSRYAEFVLAYLPKEWERFDAHNDTEELEVKYKAEKEKSASSVVFYTTIPVHKLTFLMEYAMIDGYLDFSNFHQYIKKKLHHRLGLNLNMDSNKLLTAAKLSVERDEAYWQNLAYQEEGKREVFDLVTMLPGFLDDPAGYTRGMDTQVKQAFLFKVQEHNGQEPFEKPEETVAQETTTKLLNGLAYNNIDQTLLKVYYKWIDSTTLNRSLQQALKEYKLPQNLDIWQVHPDHPFEQIDRSQLQELSSRLNDQAFIDHHKPFLKRRSANKCARIMGIDWWQSFLTVIEFNANGIKTITSLKEAIQYYQEQFYKLDRAIRKLYAEFLNDQATLKPIQEHYEAILSEFLFKWFENLDTYQENQTGQLKSLIKNSSHKTAVIVGDGINYELAKEVEEQLSKNVQTTENTILADIPSVTENNMSRLYLDNGSLKEEKKEREAHLNQQVSTSNIAHIYLDDINQSHSTYDVLVCSYKDIDDLGEKMQDKALKHFDEIVNQLANKVEELIKIGFGHVYLVSDHGFVLTGVLEEAEKVEFDPAGESLKSERFIACQERQSASDNFIQLPTNYRNYNYLLFAKNTRPFRTTGTYGYAHGGASPQELIVPCFHFEPAQSEPELKATINNKDELNRVEGENFKVKVKADENGADLFSLERNCVLKVFANKQEVASSESFPLQPGNEMRKEFSFQDHSEVAVYLVDAQNLQQLDAITVKKTSSRDLGGLM